MGEFKVYKLTKQRKAIMDILHKFTRPQSAEEIFLTAEERGTHMAITTIYRNLEILVNNHKVERRVYSDGTARYNLVSRDHRHYLICSKCSKKVPINTCPIKEIEYELSEKTGFKITGHNVEIFGYCTECWESINKDEHTKS